ncbi:hypothetical protein [Corynebacterium auriscanis]|uniref:hypothetical protein n=1 Tax=Corynebacterium auriscanis TaxID=99807 RepID=UPI003CF007A2
MRSMTLATVLVAISGYLILIVASHALGEADYEIFLVYWGFFFALTGLLDGLMQETTRAVTARRSTGESPLGEVAQGGVPTAAAPRGAQPIRTAGFIALVLGVGTALLSPLFIGSMSPSSPVAGAAMLSIGLASYAFQALVCGLLSAAAEWNRFAALITIDSVSRLILAVLAWAMGWHAVAFLLVTVLGAGTWLLFAAVSAPTRALFSERADTDQGAFLQRTLKAMVASGANAVIITGFPVLLKFTTDTSVPQGALAATITAVTLTRAPILVPLQRFQPALIVHFTKARDRVLAAAALPLGIVAGLAIVGGVAAYFLGRPILAVFFNEELLVAPLWLGLFTLVSGATAILMITGSAALAAERHSFYSVGWVIATIVAIGALFLDAQPELRALLALGIGPVVGAITHLGVLVFARRDSHATPPTEDKQHGLA